MVYALLISSAAYSSNMEIISTQVYILDVVMKTFEAKDIPAGDSNGFTPHITLCKLSKLRKCKG